MVNREIVQRGTRRLIRVFFFLLILCGLRTSGYAQEMPPRPISVEIGQNLCFGALYGGTSGGMVTVSPYGVRSATGTIVLINQGYIYNPAIFYLIGNPGTVIHIMNGPDAVLTGNHGGTLTVHLGEISPGSPIILQAPYPERTKVILGGTLNVGNPMANPAGDYSGFFSLMFIQE
jgi:hypothetical protein